MCLTGFVAYLIFVLLVIILSRSVGLLQSGLGELIALTRERLEARDRFGVFLAAGLIIFRFVFGTAVFSFLTAGFTAALGVCNAFNTVETLKVVREILQDLYRYLESLRRSSLSREMVV